MGTWQLHNQTSQTSQEVSRFPAGDHKASINGRAQKQDRNNINVPQKKHHRGTASTIFYLLDGLNQFHGTPTSPLVQMWIKTHRDRNNINDPQKKHRLGTVSKSVLLEGLNRFHGTPTSTLVQMLIKTHRGLVCIKYP